MADIFAKARAERGRHDVYSRLVKYALSLETVKAQLEQPSPVHLFCKARSIDWHDTGMYVAPFRDAESLDIAWGREDATPQQQITSIVTSGADGGSVFPWSCPVCGAEYRTSRLELLQLCVLAYDTPKRIGRQYVARLR